MEKCGECTTNIQGNKDASSLQCSLCDRCFHQSCTNLSKAACKDVLKPNSQVMFFCTVCKVAANSLVSKLAELSSKYKDLEARFDAMEQKQIESQASDQVNSKHPSAPPPPPDDKDICSEHIRAAVDAAVREMQEQKRRECNLMIFGLADSGNPNDDEEAVENVLQEVGVNGNNLRSFQRLGSFSAGKARAIKLHMSSVDAKRNALEKSNRLSLKDKYKSVYLKPDLTPLQAEKRRNLVMALKASNSEKRCMTIRAGRLVPYIEPQGTVEQMDDALRATFAMLRAK